MSQLEVLIGELLTVDGLTTSTVSTSEVTTLEHELHKVNIGASNRAYILDDSVERASLVAKSLFAGAESSEVLGGLGDNIGEQLEGDSASRGSTNGDIEKDFRVGHGVCVVRK